ncbi:hypothetical protein CPB86DRAFT_722623 [Serendipita vermifera]|nr:hypothetical protein CPB86DRAFT_722623 [Serendipita vermifera]
MNAPFANEISTLRKIAHDRPYVQGLLGFDTTPFRVPYSTPAMVAREMNLSRNSGNSREKSWGWTRRRLIMAEPISVGQPVAYSSTSLENLKPLTLQKMYVHKRHEGSYLVCRTISDPSGRALVGFAIEDEDGWALLAFVYNFPSVFRAKGRELDTLFPLNTTLIIREPRVTVGLCDHYPHIVVESPSDIIFVDSKDPILTKISWVTGQTASLGLNKPAAEWKAIGDQHLKAKEPFAAGIAYTNAIKQDPHEMSFRLGRCIAHLCFGNYALALRDAKMIIESPNVKKDDKLKALFHAAQAEYGGEHYSSAKIWYEKCLEIDSNSKAAKLDIQRCEARLRESNSGDYDWEALYKGSLSPFYRPDVANFRGPVMISDLPNGRGRGLTATRKIRTGELLIVEKPFVASYKEDFNEELLLEDPSPDPTGDKMCYALYRKLVDKVVMNPHHYKEIFDLNMGNSSTSPRPKAIPGDRSENPLHFPFDIDVARLYATAVVNGFQFGQPNTIASFNDPHEPQCIPPQAVPSALYLLPSYLKHSCIPNSTRDMFGDVMVIRARSNIAKGEEITVTYVNPLLPYPLRQVALSKWIDQCNCLLCKWDLSTDPNAMITRLGLAQMSAQPSSSVYLLQTLSKQIDTTYSQSHGSFRHLAAGVYYQLAQAVKASTTYGLDPTTLYQQSIEEAMKSLERQGIRITDREITAIRPKKENVQSLPISTDQVPLHVEGTIATVMLIAEVFSHLRIDRRAEKWMRAAIWLENASIGGGIPLFKLKYAKVLKFERPQVRQVFANVAGETYTEPKQNLLNLPTVAKGLSISLVLVYLAWHLLR